MNFTEQIQQYQQMLEKNTPGLTFPNQFEAEFRHWFLQHEGASARFVMLLMTVIWLGFFIADITRLGAIEATYKDIPMLGLVLWIRVPVLLMLGIVTALVFFSKASFLPRLVQVSYFFLTVSASVLSNIYETHGVYQSGWIPIVLIAPILILPIGIVFTKLLLLAGLCALAIVVCYVVMLEPDQRHLLNLYIFCLIISLAAGLTAGYHKEKGIRTAYILLKLNELRSFIDPLTNIGNRRYFREFGGLLLDKSHRDHEPLFFVILDIDWFKQLNDNYGHDTGDRILLKFTQLLKQHVRRPMDIVVRLGGEEFGLMFFGSDATYVLTVMQQLLTQAGSLTEHEVSDLAELRLSFSAGVTQVTADDCLDSLYARADKLMYLAKNSGRARFEFDGSA